MPGSCSPSRSFTTKGWEKITVFEVIRVVIRSPIEVNICISVCVQAVTPDFEDTQPVSPDFQLPDMLAFTEHIESCKAGFGFIFAIDRLPIVRDTLLVVEITAVDRHEYAILCVRHEPQRRAHGEARAPPRQRCYALADNDPGTVGLAAGFAAGLLCAALHIDALRVVGTAETGRVIVIGPDAELSAMIIARILPLIGCIGPARIEAVGICFVRIAAVFAAEIVGQCGSHCATDNHTGDGCASTSAAASDRVAKQATDQPSGDHPCRIGRSAAIPVVGIVTIRRRAGVALAPLLVPLIPGGDFRNNPTRNRGEEEIVVVVANPMIAAGWLPQAVLLPIIGDILILSILIGQPVSARPSRIAVADLISLISPVPVRIPVVLALIVAFAIIAAVIGAVVVVPVDTVAIAFNAVIVLIGVVMIIGLGYGGSRTAEQSHRKSRAYETFHGILLGERQSRNPRSVAGRSFGEASVLARRRRFRHLDKSLKPPLSKHATGGAFLVDCVRRCLEPSRPPQRNVARCYMCIAKTNYNEYWKNTLFYLTIILHLF